MGRKRTGSVATGKSDDHHPSTPRKGSTLREESRAVAEADDEANREEGYGRAFGAGQLFAPPEEPRL
jgi:hypothetical protein